MSLHVPLTLACGVYDRTAGLARDEIRPEGVDPTFLTLAVRVPGRERAGGREGGFMIVASFGFYAAISGHDHGVGRPSVEELLAAETREEYVI